MIVCSGCISATFMMHTCQQPYCCRLMFSFRQPPILKCSTLNHRSSSLVCKLYLVLLHLDKVATTYQQPYRRQTDVQLLVLQAKLGGHLSANLQTGARHHWQEVCHYQLQTLKGCPDQVLPTNKTQCQ